MSARRHSRAAAAAANSATLSSSSRVFLTSPLSDGNPSPLLVECQMYGSRPSPQPQVRQPPLWCRCPRHACSRRWWAMHRQGGRCTLGRAVPLLLGALVLFFLLLALLDVSVRFHRDVLRWGTDPLSAGATEASWPHLSLPLSVEDMGDVLLRRPNWRLRRHGNPYDDEGSICGSTDGNIHGARSERVSGTLADTDTGTERRRARNAEGTHPFSDPKDHRGAPTADAKSVDADDAGAVHENDVHVLIAAYTTGLGDTVCSLAASAYLSGVPLVVLGYGETFDSYLDKYTATVRAVRDLNLRSRDVVLFLDSDVIVASGLDLVRVLDRFIRYSPASPHELVARDVRNPLSRALAPFISSAEHKCKQPQLFDAQYSFECEPLYLDAGVHDFDRYAATVFPDGDGEGSGGHRVPIANRTLRFLNSGTYVTRVWAFQEVLAGVRRYMSAHEPVDAHRVSPAPLIDDSTVTASLLATGRRDSKFTSDFASATTAAFTSEKSTAASIAVVKKGTKTTSVPLQDDRYGVLGYRGRWWCDQSLLAAAYLSLLRWESTENLLSVDRAALARTARNAYGLRAGLISLDYAAELVGVVTYRPSDYVYLHDGDWQPHAQLHVRERTETGLTAYRYAYEGSRDTEKRATATATTVPETYFARQLGARHEYHDHAKGGETSVAIARPMNANCARQITADLLFANAYLTLEKRTALPESLGERKGGLVMETGERVGGDMRSARAPITACDQCSAIDPLSASARAHRRQKYLSKRKAASSATSPPSASLNDPTALRQASSASLSPPSFYYAQPLPRSRTTGVAFVHTAPTLVAMRILRGEGGGGLPGDGVVNPLSSSTCKGSEVTGAEARTAGNASHTSRDASGVQQQQRQGQQRSTRRQKSSQAPPSSSFAFQSPALLHMPGRGKAEQRRTFLPMVSWGTPLFVESGDGRVGGAHTTTSEAAKHTAAGAFKKKMPPKPDAVKREGSTQAQEATAAAVLRARMYLASMRVELWSDRERLRAPFAEVCLPQLAWLADTAVTRNDWLREIYLW